MDYDKIWSLININDLSARKFAQSIGMTGQGFKTMMESKSLRVDILEKICEVYEKPLSYFYGNSELKAYSNEEKLQVVEDGCALCREKDKRIADKEEIIRGLNKHIALLEFSLGKSLKVSSE